MENKKRKVSSVGEILPGVFKDINCSNIHEQVQLEQVWMGIAGPDSSGVMLNGFKNGTVFIIVDSSARLYHWKLRRTTILKRFQERRPDVQNIAFKIGKVI